MTQPFVEMDGLDQFEGLEDAIREAPRTVYFWIRDAYFRVAVKHRTTMLREGSIRINRRPSKNNPDPVQAPRVNETTGASIDRDVLWNVRPLERRRPDAPLDQIELDIATGNDILPTHEFGDTIYPAETRLLPVPIKAPGAKRRTSRSPGAFRRAKPKAVLIVRKSERTGTLLLFERVRKRTANRRRLRRTKSGRVSKSQPRVYVDTLIPRWALLPAVRVGARLKFYQTWDKLQQDRGAIFRKAAERIIRDIAKGIRD